MDVYGSGKMWTKLKRQKAKLSFCALLSCAFAVLSVNPLLLLYDKLPHFYLNFLISVFGEPLKISLLLIPAIALGHIARGDIHFSEELRGKWIANAGLVIAYSKVLGLIVMLTLYPSLLYFNSNF